MKEYHLYKCNECEHEFSHFAYQEIVPDLTDKNQLPYHMQCCPNCGLNNKYSTLAYDGTIVAQKTSLSTSWNSYSVPQRYFKKMVEPYQAPKSLEELINRYKE